MAEAENVITYETFRKFQKQERDNDSLQKLPEDFFQSCATWLERKGKAYEENKDPMVLKEIENVMAIIKDILDRRERKLLTMAMNAVRSNAVPRNLHAHEEKHFDSIVDMLRDMREKILAAIKSKDKSVEGMEKDFARELRKAEKEAVKSMLKTEAPDKTEPETADKNAPKEPAKEERKEESVNSKEKSVSQKTDKTEPGQIKTDKKPDEGGFPVNKNPKIVEPKGFRILKFVDEVPQFVGTDGKTCGPFKKDDIATLEEKAAEVLVQKGKAEYVAPEI